MTEHPSLAAALVAALADLTSVDKGRTANAGSYSYTYADIADVIAVTRPVLAEHGLVALTPVHGSEKGLACSVTLIHTSGQERVFDPLPFVASNDPQQAGSAITYFRRYALLAALGMATVDDDGGKGSEHARSSQGRKSTRPAEAPQRPTTASGGRQCAACGETLTGKPVKDATGDLVHERCAG
jgi:hypothetical protein